MKKSLFSNVILKFQISNQCHLNLYLKNDVEDILFIKLILVFLKLADLRIRDKESKSEFNEFEPRLKSTNPGFNWAPGFNLETLNRNLSGTNHIWAAPQI